MVWSIPTDLICSGWAPELPSIRICWLCLSASIVVIVFTANEIQMAASASKGWDVPLPPPEALMLSPVLRDPPLLATNCVPWSQLPPLSHCAIWAALHEPCFSFICCFLLSAVAFLSSLVHPHSSLSFLKSHWTQRLWTSINNLMTTALHSGATTSPALRRSHSSTCSLGILP